MNINEKITGLEGEDLGVTYKEVFVKLLCAPDNRLNAEGKRTCVRISRQIMSEQKLPDDLTDNEIEMIQSKFALITEPLIFVAIEEFFNAYLRFDPDCSE